MAGLLADIRRLNGLGDRATAEPFAGGAGASLSLLYREETRTIRINDADPAIHDFWWAVINQSQSFLELLSTARVTVDEWHRQRVIYRDRGRVSRLRRGFAAFYLNRCNRSGIIVNGGPIGGIRQAGKWRLDARFNKSDLYRRCARVAQYRDRIGVSCDDGLRFIQECCTSSSFLFIDPPYLEKGPTLYLNAVDAKYHEELAALLQSLSNDAWVLAYDDCSKVRRLYRGWARIHPFTLRYVARERRSGKEVLITPKWMRLPERQASAALQW